MQLHDPDRERGLVWFRRDLRCDDHAALFHALRDCRRVFCLFVFDTEILDPLLARGLVQDRRVEFIRASILELSDALSRLSPDRRARLLVRHGPARRIVPEVAAALAVDAVHVNHDYEPSAIDRDRAVADALERDGRALADHKDQVIFEKDEVLTQGGQPFTVFTPYKRAWQQKLTPFFVSGYPVDRYADRLAAVPAELDQPPPTLEAMGFAATNLSEIGIPTGSSGAHRLFEDFSERIGDYHDGRNYPARRGTSYLSVHLRFGTISVRTLARAAIDRGRQAAGARGAETWLSELIWRDFYFQVLHHRPDLGRGAAFRPRLDGVALPPGPETDRLFSAWCNAATGYPLVDAAMTQINSSGFMHNRLRMVTASFQSKHLALDWRLGERYFADLLNDYDLAANNGGWQWAASTGCDAQPFFRIFNPVTQSERFDPEGHFIRRYLPALAKLSNRAIHAPWRAGAGELARAGVVLGRDYPEPIVDHDEARRSTLARFEAARLRP